MTFAISISGSRIASAVRLRSAQRERRDHGGTTGYYWRARRLPLMRDKGLVYRAFSVHRLIQTGSEFCELEAHYLLSSRTCHPFRAQCIAASARGTNAP